MIELTVKTLDSQNHKYSVPDSITIREFKEKIATSVGIPHEKQRLIYCGRVLQDDKKLSEYDVNGKVIHLVQRPPPSSIPSSHATQHVPTTSSTSSSTPSTGNAHHHGGPAGLPRFPAPRSGTQDGNSFLLGAFTIPSDVMDPNQVQNIVQQVVSGMGELGRNATVMSRTSDDGSTVDVHINLDHMPLSGEANQRINFVQNIIRRANRSLDRLENPTSTPSTTEEAQNEENARSEQANNTATNHSPHVQGVATVSAEAEFFVGADAGNAAGFTAIADAARLAAAAAFAAATGISSPGSTTPSGGTGVQANPAASVTTANAASQTPPTAIPNGVADPGNPTTQQRPQPARPSALADVMDELNNLQTRFQQHFDQYRALLRDDRDFRGEIEERTRAQRLFNHVSEILHLISHAYHAVSDIMMDMSQTPPRSLRSRPFIVHQPTTVVQAGIPMQINLSGFGTIQQMSNANSAGNAAAAAAAASNASATSTTSTTSSNTTNSSGDAATNATSATRSTTNATSVNTTTTASPLFASAAIHSNPSGPFAAPNPVVFMEVGPGSITIDSISAAVVPDVGGNPQAPHIGPRFPVFPQVPPPDLIRNIVHAVGQAANARIGTNGQSQARGNTATLPTTSTQTRSTSRPIQTIPLAIPGFALASFDPYLPCSSHHVTHGRRSFLPLRRPAQQQQQQFPQSSQQQQGTSSPSGGRPAGAQLATPLSSLVSAFFTQANAGRTGGASVAGSGSSSRPEVARTIEERSRFAHIISDIMGEGSANQSSTIADMLRGLPTYSYRQGEGLFSDLIMCVAEHISLSEFLQLVIGQTDVIDRLRPRLQEFIRNRMLGGSEPTEQNIRNSIIELLDHLVEGHVAAARNLETREEVNFPETIRNFFRIRLTAIVNQILNSSEADFAEDLNAICRLCLDELVVLNLYCLRNGAESLEPAIRNFICYVLNNVDSDMQQWATGLLLNPVRSLIPNNLDARQAEILHYVIRNLPVSEAAAETRSSPVVRTRAPVSQEPMDVTETSLPEQRPQSGRREFFGSTTMDTESRSEIGPVEPNWHREVPQEWVPIITEDVQRQRRQTSQRPFSDAYLGTMPSKRRKVVANGRLKTVGDVGNLLPDTLRRAVASSGAQPTTSVAELAEDVTANANLNSAFQDTLHDSIYNRINDDKDYQPDKFPNSEYMFHCRRNGDSK